MEIEARSIMVKIKVVFAALWAVAVAAAAYFIPGTMSALGAMPPPAAAIRAHTALARYAVDPWDDRVTAVNTGAEIPNTHSPASVLRANPKVGAVVTGGRIWRLRGRRPCADVSNATVVTEPVAKRPGTQLLIPPWCSPTSKDMSELGAVGDWIAWTGSEGAAARGLAVGDGIGVPVALVGFGIITKSRRGALLPAAAAVATVAVSLALLRAVTARYPTPTMAINIQIAFAFSLAIDYSLFIATRSTGKGTVATSGLTLLGATSALALTGSPTLTALCLASMIAIALAVGVALTFTAAMAPSVNDDDDDDALIGDAPPFAQRHPLPILAVAAVTVLAGAWAMLMTRMCGGATCMAPYSAMYDAAVAVDRDPVDLSLLLGPAPDAAYLWSTAAARLPPIQRQYVVAGAALVDLASPLPMSSAFIDTVAAITADAPANSTLIALRGLDEYEEMAVVIANRWRVVGMACGAVAAVNLLVYRAPVLALKAVCAVVGTFVVAIGITAVAFQGQLCWMVPVVGFPVGVGLGMDFHIFFLDAIKTRDAAGVAAAMRASKRVTNGAGLILAVAFAGLFGVKIKLLRQLSVYLVATTLTDTFVMRPLVIPAAMFALGRYNWWPLLK